MKNISIYYIERRYAMNLSDITNPNLFILNSDYDKKDEILRTLVKTLHNESKITSEHEFLDVIYACESLSATGMESGFAIPHGKSHTVLEPTLAVMTTNSIVKDWQSLDPNNKVQYIFLLAIPEKVDDTSHLDLLTELMSKINNPDYRENLFSSKTIDEFYVNLDYNTKKTKTKKPTKNIIAVTACPVGLAHTYMASEALIKAGEELGVDIYVEKQGANGIEDKHTSKMIKKADAVIFATDISIREPERFAFLPTIEVPVAQPIKDGVGVIKLAIDKIENLEKENISQEELETKNLNHKEIIKKAILTGISYIIPLIIAGGMFNTFTFIATNLFDFSNVNNEVPFWLEYVNSFGGEMINTLLLPVLSAYIAYSIGNRTALISGYGAGVASNIINGGFLSAIIGGIIAGYVVLLLKKLIPAKGTISNFVSFWIYPVFSNTIVALLMLIVIGRPISYINSSLVNFLGSMEGNNALLLGIIIGIMVSFDLGGVVNKAAYTFCIGAIAEGITMPYAVFASVKMVSGFAISFATIIAHKIYPNEDRELGKSTWILALAGITEGAIPFMVRDPINVIIAMCTGSAFTGAIVASFGIGLDIPGAGIFSLFMLQSNNLSPIMTMTIWFFSAFFGAIISAFLLIIARKRKFIVNPTHSSSTPIS